MSDLAKRLRDSTEFYHSDCELKMEAADRIEELEKQIKKDALQYLSDAGQMQDTIADLNATLNQIPDHAYNAGMLKGILVGIVDWAYHQKNKPEWLDGAEGILRKVKND